MCDARFFICKHGGNIIELLNSSGVPVVCCGDEMEELIPGTVDASYEKHVPAVTVDGDTVTVKVGSVAHPMIPEHYIQWIYLKTENTVQRKCLNPARNPKRYLYYTEKSRSRPMNTATCPASGNQIFRNSGI